MKYSKAAAIVAGSLVALGAGSPALAADRPFSDAQVPLAAGVEKILSSDTVGEITTDRLDKLGRLAGQAAGVLKKTKTADAAKVVGATTPAIDSLPLGG